MACGKTMLWASDTSTPGVPRINAIADFDRNGFKVEMEFFVINRTDPITINFFLERIR
jgi:hypothetical protein